MKSNKSVLQSAVLGALLVMAAGAQAGNLATTTRTFATEDFGPTQAATVAITPAAVSYSISSPGGVTVAATQTTTLYLRLSGTNVFAVAPLAAQFTGAFNTSFGAPTVTWAAGATAGTVAVTYTNGTGVAVNLPVNSAVIYTPAAGAVTATTSTLATAGGTITVTGSLSGLPANNAATTLPSDQDPISSPATIANSATAVTGAITAASSFATPETAKINLAAVPSGALFTTPVNGTTTLLNLGSVTWTNNPTIIPTTLAGVNYALPGAAAVAGAIFAGNSVTVTPSTGAAFPVGATLSLNTGIGCATATISNVVTWAAASTTAVLTAIAADATPGTAIPSYVCLTVPGTLVIAANAPTATASLTKTVATDAADAVASTALYALADNGSVVNLRTYIPAQASGYTSYVRVINTGTISAPISVAVINPTTGVAGTPVTLISSLAAGASQTLSSAAVEAITGQIGAAGGAVQYRLQFTAPTNGLQVQSLLLTPTGNLTDITGAQ